LATLALAQSHLVLDAQYGQVSEPVPRFHGRLLEAATRLDQSSSEPAEFRSDRVPAIALADQFSVVPLHNREVAEFVAYVNLVPRRLPELLAMLLLPIHAAA
jgi:hypothetical protein